MWQILGREGCGGLCYPRKALRVCHVISITLFVAVSIVELVLLVGMLLLCHVVLTCGVRDRLHQGHRGLEP